MYFLQFMLIDTDKRNNKGRQGTNKPMFIKQKQNQMKGSRFLGGFLLGLGL